MMEDKRRYERLPITLELEVSNLFKQDCPPIHIDDDAEIEVFDISKAGIGFMSDTELPIGYYFNATLQFETTEEIILSVVKILYKAPIGSAGYRYGCEFVGLPSMYDHIFEEYGASVHAKEG